MNSKHPYWVGFITIIHKEVQRFARIWLQTILPPAITTLLYFIIFGHLMGPRIGKIEDFSYVQYIAPGLIMMSVINNAYSNVSSSFFLAKFTRNVEELLISPLPNYLIILGYVIGGVFRGLAVAIVVSIIALFFTHLTVHHLGVTLVVILLTATLFALAGFINAVYAQNFDGISIIPTFILTPLTYLGGVFYSVQLLPGFWHTLSLMNPILYMVNAFRYGVLGTSDVDVMFALLIIVLCTVALFIFALWLLASGTGLRR
ncbi:MAG: ABC transporter permease [Gammaproteobacteria bacterium]